MTRLIKQFKALTIVVILFKCFFLIKSLQLNLPDLYAYGELEWINMHLFLLGKHHQRLKAYCFV
ncbi:unnamed protein product, partial [Rotaria magnacalcarata]